MAVIHVRRRAEEAFLAELALEGALGQVGMGLARGEALDLGKGDVFRAAHGVLRSRRLDSRRLLVSYIATNIVADGTNGQDPRQPALWTSTASCPTAWTSWRRRSAAPCPGLYKDRYGLAVPEWRVLAHLGQYAPITAKAIAAHSRMHKTKVSRAVAELEELGFVVRADSDEDRREELLVPDREGQGRL